MEPTIQHRPSKTELREQFVQSVHVQCDPHVQDVFKDTYYTIEPLLLQLIAEIKTLREHVEHLASRMPS